MSQRVTQEPPEWGDFPKTVKYHNPDECWECQEKRKQEAAAPNTTFTGNPSAIPYASGSPDTFTDRFYQLGQKERDVQVQKRADYTGGADPLSNYRTAASVMGISCALAMVGRMQEKVTRLSNILQAQSIAVKEESAADTLLDIGILAKLIAIEVGSE